MTGDLDQQIRDRLHQFESRMPHSATELVAALRAVLDIPYASTALGRDAEVHNSLLDHARLRIATRLGIVAVEAREDGLTRMAELRAELDLDRDPAPTPEES